MCITVMNKSVQTHSQTSFGFLLSYMLIFFPPPFPANKGSQGNAVIPVFLEQITSKFLQLIHTDW